LADNENGEGKCGWVGLRFLLRFGSIAQSSRTIHLLMDGGLHRVLFGLFFCRLIELFQGLEIDWQLK
jgi:hypothetical protein